MVGPADEGQATLRDTKTRRKKRKHCMGCYGTADEDKQDGVYRGDWPAGEKGLVPAGECRLTAAEL